MLSHAEAETILDPYKGLLREVVDSAWRDYCSLRNNIPHVFTPRTRASIIHDFMVSHARNKLAGIKGVRLLDVGGLFLVEINEKILIRFKKLNDDKMPNNIPTQQALDFMEQLELPGMPHIIRLVVGYELNKLQTGIQAISVTCPRGTKKEWHFELEGVVTEVADIVELPTPGRPVDPVRLRAEETIKIKKQNE